MKYQSSVSFKGPVKKGPGSNKLLHYYIIQLGKKDALEVGNIIFSLIVVFSLLVGTLAILQRSTGSYLGSFFSAKGRGSRDAAEYGVKYLISEFAVPNNRKLSIVGESPSSWSSLPASAVVNPCLGVATRPSTNIINAANSITTVPGSANKKFFLKSISFTNDSGSGSRNSIKFSRVNASSSFQPESVGTFDPNAINIAGVSRGYLKLTVVGQETGALGVVVSSTEISREFEIVPKCCQRSFGYTFLNTASPQPSHGNDLRSCPAFGLGNLNLVVGANGGVFNNNGSAYDLWKGSLNNPQDIAITLNPDDAQTLTNRQQTNLVYSTTELPQQTNTLLNAPSIPGSACINDANSVGTQLILPSNGLPGNIKGNCTSSATPTGQPQTVYQEAGDAQGNGSNASCTSGIPGRSVPRGAILVDSQKLDLPSQNPINAKCYVSTTRQAVQITPDPFCTEVSKSNGTKEFFCLVRHVDFNGQIKIDSTAGKVNLLFYDASNTSLQGNRIVQGGSVTFSSGSGSGFVHEYNNQAATVAQTDRFAIYNNITGSDFQLKGATGALAGFFDLRYSDVDLRGGGGNDNINLSGILWSNNLSLGGNLTLVNPPSGPCIGNVADFAPGSTCAILASLYPQLFDGDATNDNIRPAFDWVPRSVFTSSMH
jgi:hypothetical protein